MKRPAFILLFIAWVIVASAVLTRTWLVYPDVFPAIPASLAETLATAYGARNAEEVADLEMLISFGVSVPLVAALSWILLRLVDRRA